LFLKQVNGQDATVSGDQIIINQCVYVHLYLMQLLALFNTHVLHMSVCGRACMCVCLCVCAVYVSVVYKHCMHAYLHIVMFVDILNKTACTRDTCFANFVITIQKVVIRQTFWFIGCAMKKTDVVFIVDTSGSIEFISFDGFQWIIQFIQSTVKLFSISVQESLAGVILFSTTATLQFNVQMHTDIESLSKAIYQLPYDGGSTNTAAALDLLLSSAQDGTMGLRSGYHHIAILITDGASSDYELTLLAAQRLHGFGIFNQVYAVGIHGADNSELNAIASEPSLVLVSDTFSYDAILQLQQSLSLKLCEGT